MAMTGTCLVLGANGFLGSYFVDGLAEAGYSVVAYDRYTREPQFQKHERVQVVTGGADDDDLLQQSLHGVDYVFYCFAGSTPFSADKNPYSDVDGLRENIRIFALCATAQVKKIVYISSGGAVYGHIAETKNVSEDDVPTPVSPYGICKLASENYLAYFKQTQGIDYLVFRLSNPYGPRQIAKNNQGVIPSFISKIQKGETLNVLGDGSGSRDYIYVSDAVRMMIGCFESAKQKVYNIGCGEQTSVEAIISTLREIMPTAFEVHYTEAPKTFLTKAQLNTQRYVSEFGNPQLLSLKEGLRLTIDGE